MNALTSPSKPVRRRNLMVLAWLVALGVQHQAAHASLTISFDYSLDTSDFFADGARRALLDSAASTFTGRILDTLDIISPGGGNTWEARFTHPATGLDHAIVDPTISAGSIVVYVGARDLPGSTLGVGGPGGFSISGTAGWLDEVRYRGEAGASLTPPTDFGPWGGVISFDSLTSWYFDTDLGSVGDIPGVASDFYSVAVHELGHVLGYGTADSWNNWVSGLSFSGPASKALNGGANVSLANDAHWAEGLMSVLPGTAVAQEASMDPSITVGTRKFFTEMDYAGLQDVGWELSAVPEPAHAATLAALALLAFARWRRAKGGRAHASP